MKNLKNIIFLIILISIIFTLTGCAKYEKDESYDTDLYGSYSHEMGTPEGSDIQYYSYAMYQFNSDNTYHYESKEISSNETTQDINEDGKILSVEEISDDITKITLDKEIDDWSIQESSNLIMYKYKNMVSYSHSYIATEIPNGKNFDLIIPTPHENWTGSHPNSAIIFDKNGFYHSCLDSTNCNDTEENHIGVYYKYIRKGNLIYFIDTNAENPYYQILYYIVDDAMFYPDFIKQNNL